MTGHRSQVGAHRARWLLVGIAITAAVAVGGCNDSSSGASSSGKPKSDASSPAAEITQFEVPASIACGGKTSTTVTVTYATSNAATVQLYVDGLHIDGVSQPRGTSTTPLHCDGLPHDVVLKAVSQGGKPTTDRKLVNTDTTS